MLNKKPDNALMRLPQILELIPISRSAWWAGCKSGKYPKPVKLGPRTTAWRASDIAELLKRRYRLADFPNGIFSVAGVEPDKKETVVKYRVNPMAMTPETPAAQRDAYAAAPVPKGVPVRLVQVP